jgi:hypothetical protein
MDCTVLDLVYRPTTQQYMPTMNLRVVRLVWRWWRIKWKNTSTKCLNWDVLAIDGSTLGRYTPPKGYPLVDEDNCFWYQSNPACRLVMAGGGQQFLCPFKITYNSLRLAVSFAHEAYCKNWWTYAQCALYLQVEGLDDKFIDKVLQHSSRSCSLAVAMTDPQRYQAIINESIRNPAKYQQVQNPAPCIRPTIGLELHPDVIMHLLFLGVVKTILRQVVYWFRSHLHDGESWIKVIKVDTEEELADLFTKPLAREPSKKLRFMLMGWWSI